MPEHTSETRSAWRSLVDAVESIGDVIHRLLKYEASDE